MVDASPGPLHFSYSDPHDPWVKRLVIRTIERATGQPYLKWLYEDFRNNSPSGRSFWDEAIRRLELTIACNEHALTQAPRNGALVVVANHPFGVLDGLVICHLVSRIRPDFRVLTNELLTRAEELKPWLLPVDFAETREARETNLKTRADARQHLIDGGCLVVFPAGGVSTTPSPFAARAIDAEWKNLTGRLIMQARAPVLPVYFAGQNSRLFQLASHVSLTLRLALLFKEVHDRIGSELLVRVGEVIPFARIAEINDRQAVMDFLRQRTYALGENLADPPKPKTRRPRRPPRSQEPRWQANA